MVLSEVALNFVRDVDPALHDSLTQGQVVFDRMRIVHRGEAVMLERNTFYRMARLDLLRGLLAPHCGPALDVRPNSFAWYGTPQRFTRRSRGGPEHAVRTRSARR